MNNRPKYVTLGWVGEWIMDLGKRDQAWQDWSVGPKRPVSA